MLKIECAHHYDQLVLAVIPRAEVCGLEGSLPMCATCGFVGCCESRNSHDTAHWNQSGHAIIIQLPISGRLFAYCYEHAAYLLDEA